MQESRGPAPLDFSSFQQQTPEERLAAKKAAEKKSGIQGAEIPKRQLYQGTERIGSIDQSKPAEKPETNRSRFGKILDFFGSKKEQAPPKPELQSAASYVQEYISGRADLNIRLGARVEKVGLNQGDAEKNAANLRKKLENDLSTKLGLLQKEIDSGRLTDPQEIKIRIEKGIQSSLEVISARDKAMDIARKAQPDTAPEVKVIRKTGTE